MIGRTFAISKIGSSAEAVYTIVGVMPREMPMFDKVVQMRLTICTRLGCVSSNPSTDAASPVKECFSNSGFFD